MIYFTNRRSSYFALNRMKEELLVTACLENERIEYILDYSIKGGLLL